MIFLFTCLFYLSLFALIILMVLYVIIYAKFRVYLKKNHRVAYDRIGFLEDYDDDSSSTIGFHKFLKEKEYLGLHDHFLNKLSGMCWVTGRLFVVSFIFFFVTVMALEILGASPAILSNAN